MVGPVSRSGGSRPRPDAVRAVARAVRAWPADDLRLLVRAYQRWVSPLLPRSCRFFPTCSSYAVEALRVHGAMRGSVLTLIRLAKCAPWHPGGVDHVPGRSAPVGAPTTEERSC